MTRPRPRHLRSADPSTGPGASQARRAGAGAPAVKILGAGCVRCRTLAARTRAALDTLGIEASVEMIDDPWEIARYGVMYIPALVVDEKVVLVGKVPKTNRLCTLIEGAITS